MIKETQLIRGNGNIKISENLIVHIPTLKEIDDFGEELYYSSISLICSTSSDYKLFLWDTLKTDWIDITDYQWFCMFYKSIENDFSKLIFKNLLLSELELVIDNKSQKICLIDKFQNIIFTEEIYMELTKLIRTIHGFERTFDNPGNKVTHDYFLKKERKKLKRKRNNNFKSIIFPIICSLVNSSNFKYNYESVWEINIFQLMESLKRIQKIYNFNQFMTGIYSGMVDTSKIDTNTKDEIMNWFGANK